MRLLSFCVLGASCSDTYRLVPIIFTHHMHMKHACLLVFRSKKYIYPPGDNADAGELRDDILEINRGTLLKPSPLLIYEIICFVD